MAWDTTMVVMVRILINDTEEPQTYSDARLESLITTAAFYVKNEIDFDTTYSVNIVTPDISPDPTLEETLDDVYTGFVVLKAACITDISTFRTQAAISGLTAKCDKVSLDTKSRLEGFIKILEMGACAAYTKSKFEYEIGNAQACHAILSPFAGPNVDPDAIWVNNGPLENIR